MLNTLKTLLKAFLLLLTFCAMSGSVNAQTPDSDSVFHINTFSYGDIVERRPDPANKVYAANRIAESADELPNKTYIITQEQILANGYTTLPDVLKTIPGFRVSQPGSALLGETFLMRGMLGNSYTKILINGIPIKPSAAPGMPIGAQLPIKQAERIEIILGPASTLYGADAMAGVINIVLPTVDRPVEAMASLGLGTLGADEMHLQLGGKTGKDKNILNYNFYASSRRIQSMNLDFDEELYEVDDRTWNNPLYVGEEDEPAIEDIPHVSRLVGLQANFRGLTLNANYMFRTDHSALGTHPTEVSWHDPNTYTGEVIYSTGLRYDKEFANGLWIQSNASWLSYEMDENSTYYGVSHPLSNDWNFMYAESNDYFFEQIGGYTHKRWSFMGGASYLMSYGTSFQQYLQDPFEEENIIINPMGDEDVFLSADDFSLVDSVSSLNSYFDSNLGVFGQVYYKGERLSVLAGLRYDNPNVTDGAEISPKLGVFYKFSEKTRVRGFFGQGFRMPASYYRDNNYREVPGTGPMTPPRYRLDRINEADSSKLVSEHFVSYEVGLTHQFSDEFSAELSFFHHDLENAIIPVLNYPAPPGEQNQGADSKGRGFVGFKNGESFARLNSIQAAVQYTIPRLRVALSGQYSWGVEDLDTVLFVDRYRGMPDVMAKLNVETNLKSGLRFGVHALYSGNVLEMVVASNEDIITTENNGFYNIDLVISQRFDDYFSAYLKVQNVTNSRNRGLYTNPHTGFEFDYMPQYRTIFWLGLTFNLN